MTKETYIKLKPILDAWAIGKTIQFRRINHTDWTDFEDSEIFANTTNYYEFRLKPEPREFWVLEFTSEHKPDYIYPSYQEAVNASAKEKGFSTKIFKVLEILE
jgi:hypothetical protein